jgi:hypothetical protein
LYETPQTFFRFFNLFLRDLANHAICTRHPLDPRLEVSHKSDGVDEGFNIKKVVAQCVLHVFARRRILAQNLMRSSAPRRGQRKISPSKLNCGHRCTGENSTGTEMTTTGKHPWRAIIGFKAEKKIDYHQPYVIVTGCVGIRARRERATYTMIGEYSYKSG